MDKKGDVVRAARCIWGLQMQTQAQLIAWTACVEAGAVLDHWIACFLVPQVARETLQAPGEDTMTLLGL